ncbi:YraN family protein [Azonexus sp.]|uniref:YraN family protein n=1 Tax=Azonexus sp. TaxID=1872668 RepID=UPI0039E50A97
MPAKTKDTTVARGHDAESRALAYLEARGLRLVTRNFHVKGGEIDLILYDGPCLVFVEVRQRKNAAFGGAAASITRQKQARILLAARHYLARHGESACRFDCLLLEGGQIEWLQNAFGSDF